MKKKYFTNKLYPLFIFSLFAILLILVSCASSRYINAHKSAANVPRDMARVIFKRDTGVLGSGVPHIVLDKSPNIQHRGIVIRSKKTKYNKILWLEDGMKLTAISSTIRIKGICEVAYIIKGGGNVKESIYKNVNESIIFNDPFSLYWCKSPFQITYFCDGKNYTETRNTLDSNEEEIEKMLILFNAYKEKATILGLVGFNDTIEWDRPAGPLTLEVFEPVGDKKVYNIENVEAGKITNILYHSPLGRIEVTVENNINLQ